MFNELRSRLIRLAHTQPELRADLLPLLNRGGAKRTASMSPMLALSIKEAASLLVKTLSGSAYPVEALTSFRVVVETCTMFARRGVKDPILTGLLLKARGRLSEIIEETQFQDTFGQSRPEDFDRL